MLRQIFMLMALLSGFSALCAPEQALAAQEQASQVEAGNALDGDVPSVSYVDAFGAPHAPLVRYAKPQIALSAASAHAPCVALRVDRSRE